MQNISEEELVHVEALQAGESLPLVIRPATEGVDLLGWACRNGEHIEQLLSQHGGILFSGFGLRNSSSSQRPSVPSCSPTTATYPRKRAARKSTGPLPIQRIKSFYSIMKAPISTAGR